MKIALFQLNLAWEDKQANFDKVEAFAEKSKNQKIDLIVLPELFSTAYTMNCRALAEDLSGETPSFLSKLAKEYNAHILGSFIEQSQPKPKNSALLFDNKGSLLLHYSKIHLPSFVDEDKHYSPGKEIPVCEVGNQKLGVTICYDLRFPELFRKLTDKGAKCIFVISSWPKERINHWDLLLRARAVENQVFIVGVNSVGKSPLCLCPGHSAVIDPFAKEIASAEENEETIILCDIDFSLVNDIREKYPILKDRKL